MLAALRAFVWSQAGVALASLLALEAIFEVMRRLGNLKVYVIETITLALAAGVVYFIALYALGRSRESRVAFWLILAGALVFRLTLVPLEPSLSTDIYRYHWDGRIQQAGWNPYSVAPDDPRLASLRDAYWPAMPGQEIPTIYPPVAELMFRLTWQIAPGPVAFKLPFLLADLLVVCMLAGWMRLTGGSNSHLAIYAWNPLVVVEFAASGHSDAPAIAGVLAALLIIRRRPVMSTLALTAAALTKAFPVVLLPLWLRRAGWRNIVWVVLFSVACAWPYRSAWRQIPTTLAYYESRWQNNNSSLYTVLVWFAGSTDLAAGLGVGVVAGLALWAAARRLDPVRAAYILFGAILMLSPNAYSWYFTWIVPLLCFYPNPAWLLLTVLQFLSYNVLIGYQATGRWHFDPFMQWLTYGPFYALLLWQVLRGPREAANTT